MADRYDFRVVVEGIDLDPGVKERLAGAVGDAALQVLAGLDQGGDFVSLRAPRGRLDGRSIRLLGAGQAETLGLES